MYTKKHNFIVSINTPIENIAVNFWLISSSPWHLGTACSTVLLPARVVQALNLNVEDLGARPIYPGGFALDHGN